MILIGAPEIAGSVLQAWRRLPEGRGVAQIGVVTETPGRVVLQTVTGGRRLVDVPRGELLPRIC
jgi:hydrogenase expression/formation protein HypE